MKTKSNVLVDNAIGVCLKGPDKVVTFQNDMCKNACGDMTGKVCDKGCMKQLAKLPTGSLKKDGFVVIKNIFHDENVVDAVLLNNDGNLTTLIFDITQKVDEQMLLLKPYELTPVESSVARMVLEGASNGEIAKKHGIARSTLKSHLNHIYRKLPETLRKEMSSQRPASGTKELLQQASNKIAS